MAIRCGERLLATAQPVHRGIAWTTLDDQPPLGGFSHGTAGIALSLLQLAARSGQDRFRHAALSALGYDRSLFVPELNNWADLRVFAPRTIWDDPVEPVVEPSRKGPPRTGPHRTSPPRKSMVAWCHGAPGIGLARLAALFLPADQSAHIRVGQQVHARIGASGPAASGVVARVEPGVTGPDAARTEYGFEPGADTVRQPWTVVIVQLGQPLSPAAYGGSLLTARVETGSQRILTLLPGLGASAGGAE